MTAESPRRSAGTTPTTPGIPPTCSGPKASRSPASVPTRTSGSPARSSPTSPCPTRPRLKLFWAYRIGTPITLRTAPRTASPSLSVVGESAEGRQGIGHVVQRAVGMVLLPLRRLHLLLVLRIGSD